MSPASHQKLVNKVGRDARERFIYQLELITRLVNIGDAKSLACHPATTTHRQLNDEELAAAGVSSDLVRLSIGIEHIDDIIDRKSTRLNSSHVAISYAVFCLRQKNKKENY